MSDFFLMGSFVTQKKGRGWISAMQSSGSSSSSSSSSRSAVEKTSSVPTNNKERIWSNVNRKYLKELLQIFRKSDVLINSNPQNMGFSLYFFTPAPSSSSDHKNVDVHAHTGKWKYWTRFEHALDCQLTTDSLDTNLYFRVSCSDLHAALFNETLLPSLGNMTKTTKTTTTSTMAKTTKTTTTAAVMTKTTTATPPTNPTNSSSSPKKPSLSTLTSNIWLQISTDSGLSLGLVDKNKKTTPVRVPGKVYDRFPLTDSSINTAPTSGMRAPVMQVTVKHPSIMGFDLQTLAVINACETQVTVTSKSLEFKNTLAAVGDGSSTITFSGESKHFKIKSTSPHTSNNNLQLKFKMFPDSVLAMFMHSSLIEWTLSPSAICCDFFKALPSGSNNKKKKQTLYFRAHLDLLSG
jgi:hypothetical protein